MLRTVLCFVLTFALAGFAAAADKDTKDKAHKGQQATITKVDAKNQTITVRMQDKEGKEVERTFHLTGDMRYFDSTGRVAAADFFRSGDYVLVIEEEGRLKELHAAPQGSGGQAQWVSDQAFLKEAEMCDMAEMKFAKLAQQDASSAALKRYAERITSDHAKMNQELRDLAKRQNANFPEKLDAKHEQLWERLSKLKGSEFDRAFAKDMVEGHEKAIQKFEAEIKHGQDASVKAWAEKWLPTLREHLNLARETVKNVNAGH